MNCVLRRVLRHTMEVKKRNRGLLEACWEWTDIAYRNERLYREALMKIAELERQLAHEVSDE